MMVYVAFLRGVNVGGKNMIKMAALSAMIEEMGFSRVQTYIQSGNVLFESEGAERAEEALRKQIEAQLNKNFGLAVDVILRSAAELKQIMLDCPFSREEIAEAESTAVGESLYVALLPYAPAAEKVDRLHALKHEGEKIRIRHRDVYLLFSNSIRNSKLANSLPKLDAAVTVRNWKTISKLNVMAQAMLQEMK